MEKNLSLPTFIGDVVKLYFTTSPIVLCAWRRTFLTG